MRGPTTYAAPSAAFATSKGRGSSLLIARIDPKTGTVSGVIADIARELGRRADVPVTITPLPTAAAVIEAIRSGAADIGFVAPNPMCIRVRGIRTSLPMPTICAFNRMLTIKHLE